MARRQTGLSLIEVLVALTILSVAMVVALSIYDGARRSYKVGEQVSEQQQNVRMAFDVLISDLRLAGLNTDPDGNPSRTDEQIEAAYETALVVRADFDGADPARSSDPEATLAGGAFSVVSTGNDELRGFGLRNPGGGGGPDVLAFDADVVPDRRDGVSETVQIGGVVLDPSSPPYALYRLALDNDPAAFGTPGFVNPTVLADNVRALRFRYFDRAGNEIAAPGGADTPEAIRARASIASIEVAVEMLTRDPDPLWEDPSDSNPATRHFRKFPLAGRVTPRNLHKRGLRDLVADGTPPAAPGAPGLYPGHCGGLLLSWDENPASDRVAYYRIHAGTDPFLLLEQRFSDRPSYFLSGLTDATSYYVAIQAVDDSGNPSPLSPISTVVTENTTVPRPPQDLVAETIDGGAVKLRWSAVRENADATVGDAESPLVRDLAGYRVHRSDVSGFSPDVGNRIGDETVVPAVPAPEFVDTRVAGCRPVYYKVVAADACGTPSPPGDEISVVGTTGAAPSAPGGLLAYFDKDHQVGLKWDHVLEDVAGQPTSVDRYDVYHSPPVPVGDPPPPPGSFSYAGYDTGLYLQWFETPVIPMGHTVWYLVKAVDSCTPARESVPSEPVQPTCEFSGEVWFVTPTANTEVGGATTVTVDVLNGTGSYESARVRFTSAVDGSEFEVPMTGSGPPWHHVWNAADPAVTPGVWRIRAEVDQRGSTTVCTSALSILVVVEH